MKKVVVLGGAGAMGQVIVRDLSQYGNFDQIIIADFNKHKAQELCAKVANPKLSACFADINKHQSLVEAFSGAQVLINSTPYYFNVAVMEAALEANCNYMDLGGLFHVTREQQKLDEKFRSKNLLAILGMGAAPGMTNVMAAAAAEQLDTLDSIDIVVGCVDFVETDVNHPLPAPYAIDTILDEYTKEPMVYEDGRFIAKPPMSGEVLIDFPAPVGQCSAILTLHSEVATLPESYRTRGIKNVTFRLGLPQTFHDKLKLLVDIGFGGTQKLRVDDAEIVPRRALIKLLERFPAPAQDPDDCEIVRVDVHGRSKGEKKLIRVETTVVADKAWKVSCGALDTGVPPSIVAQLIVNRQIDANHTGVLAPELCIPIQPFFNELKKRAIEIRIETIPAVSGELLAR
jgi:saccharopine dehydrogenase-like NADP-dependent oxidoreductase